MKEKKPSGRPKLADAKLTEEQIQFCKMEGNEIKRSEVIKVLGISPHQYRAWKKVPQMIALIEKYRTENKMKATGLFIKEYWNLGVTAIQDLIYEIKKSKKEKKPDMPYLNFLYKLIEGHKEGIERTGKVIYEQTRELTAKETKTITDGKGDIEAGIKELEDSKEVEEEETE